MASERKVSEEALAMLAREATVCDLVYEFKENRDKQAITRMIAEHSGDDPLNVIKAYTDCVFNGVTPPPNILALIAEWFTIYLDSKENINLDYAFKLKSIQKSGHSISKRNTELERSLVFYYMWSMKKKAKKNGVKLSIPKAAEMAVNELRLEYNHKISTLEKYYTDLKMEKIFDEVNEAYYELINNLEKIQKK